MSRRSARTTQPIPGNMNNGSTSSSVSSSRIDRHARTNPRQDSLTKSLTPQSSSDDAEGKDRYAPEARQTRQKKKMGQGGPDGTDEKPIERDAEEEEDPDEEEEVTRCICGQAEYPGPPVPIAEGSRGHQPKETQRAASLAASESLPEEPGSLFIQCDECHVWQHGGCVGIMEEATSPDNYYCEQCKPELHKILTGARGQKFSRYLPVFDVSQIKTPHRTSGNKDGDSRSSKEAESRGGNSAAYMSSAKRRSTMNSRAAVDEEEAFRKAIEESKTQGTPLPIALNGSRKQKRGREDESDVARQDLKRRKTGSESDSPIVPNPESTAGDSDNDALGLRTKASGGSRKSRGTAVQSLRESEMRERERGKERERSDAAGRRKGRAERRNVDESEPSEQAIQANSLARNANAAKLPPSRPQVSSKAGTGSTPPISNTSTSHKKGARPVARRGRVGRNQYTKDRDTGGADNKRDSPMAPHSRDSEDMGNGASDGLGSNTLSNGTKPSKPRHMNPNRTSMNDLRKRAAGILEYITRTQVEMAGEKTPPSTDNLTGGTAAAGASSSPSLSVAAAAVAKSKAMPLANGASKLSHEVDASAEADESGGGIKTEEGRVGVDEEVFGQLSSLQMMDVLTRELVLWQKDHGKWGEK